MIRFDPSPWLLFTAPFWCVVAYVCYRGLARNEFRTSGRWGWHGYRRRSPEWYVATLINLTFLGVASFLLCRSALSGSEFSHEPELAMPGVTGSPIQTVALRSSPGVVARCLADLDHGTVYVPSSDRRRVVVRNGRNQIMYIFDILPEGRGSRMNVYRSLPSPFVGWRRCVAQLS